MIQKSSMPQDKQNRDMQYRAHPWHGLSLGEEAPEIVNCYIEMVPTDTVKYELDKATGILKVDRPQKYSSLCPSLYGLLPQTYCGPLVAKYCIEKTGLTKIVGDGDPLDICVLTEKVIPRGDIMLRAYPIGGFRLIDGEQADDKIIAVLMGDFIYEKFKDISKCPESLVERLRHYFLTYKDAPDRTNSLVQITHTYGAAEAHKIIKLSQQDYQAKF
jgi:inorganic pyrophosphatase